MRVAGLLALSMVAARAEEPGVVQRGEGWIYTRLGKAEGVERLSRPGFLLAGGGSDLDAAFAWFCGLVKSGDLLVLRVSGDAAYNPYLRNVCPELNSVSTLEIKTRPASSDSFVKSTILRAGALFIAGGDQSNYVKLWAGTPVSLAIDELARRGVPIGGTSAGLAILPEFSYSALHDTVNSREALSNPFDSKITIERGFLHLSPFLRNTITDTHFAKRDRMGRSVAFLARMLTDYGLREARAVAVDEKAAFLMAANGQGHVVGEGSAYFLKVAAKPEVCRAGAALTLRGVSVKRVPSGGTFDLSRWGGTSVSDYRLSAVAGVLQSTEDAGRIY